MLLTKYGYFWNFLIKNPDYLKCFVGHTYNDSICNIMIKLLLVDGVEKNEFNDSEQKKEPEDKFLVQFNIIIYRKTGLVYCNAYFRNIRFHKIPCK